MPSDPENELASVIASAQELLLWEKALGGTGFPTPEPSTSPQAALGSQGAELGDQDTLARLQVLAEEAAACTRCELHRGRTKSVFARGTIGTLVCAS